MKRQNNTPDKTKKNIRRVKKIFPIFTWKKCIKCDNEFRFEWGYKFELSYKFNNRKIHLCPECGRGKKNACDLFLSREEALDRKRLRKVQESLLKNRNRKRWYTYE